MSRLALALLLTTIPAALHAQNLPPATAVSPSTNPAVAPPTNPSKSPFTYSPMQMPKLPPGVLELLKLEGQFSESVSAGGGKAFSTWFADDGVTLNNGQPAVRGRSAIASIANWDPATYKLSWYAEGAQIGPSNDTGFTWGHYDATTIAKDGKSTTTAGRYITFWKKVHGEWKVALDASANEPPPTNGKPTP
ncbi:MAG TPA: nuclear transport factor 2 family protein [Acidobacteriaceae bacterium]|nr:nuclear transport factor 2 family protein [Acidobacteriaceae bacterium]